MVQRYVHIANTILGVMVIWIFVMIAVNKEWKFLKNYKNPISNLSLNINLYYNEGKETKQQTIYVDKSKL